MEPLSDIAAILRVARDAGRSALSEPVGKALLSRIGIRVPDGCVLGPDEAARDAPLPPGPLAVKVIAEGALHKSDVGGVRLGIRDPAHCQSVIDEMRAACAAHGIRPEGWLVERMAPPGTEIVIGGAFDAEFGPLIMVGIGGIFVETLKDVSFRICPITHLDAREMIADLRGAPLLDGARGRARVDRALIVDALLRMGGEDGLLVRHGEHLAEFDINPLIVGEREALAVDARFVLRPPQHAPCNASGTEAVAGAS